MNEYDKMIELDKNNDVKLYRRREWKRNLRRREKEEKAKK